MLLKRKKKKKQNSALPDMKQNKTFVILVQKKKKKFVTIYNVNFVKSASQNKRNDSFAILGEILEFFSIIREFALGPHGHLIKPGNRKNTGR